jgi:predicted metal-dependent peptidase
MAHIDDIDRTLLQKAVSKSKLQLMMAKNTTFFSALLANLDLQITADCKTAATNGIFLLLNPVYISTLTQAQLLGLILHEVFHVAYDHINYEAYKNLDADVLNIAQDHYINLLILSLGYELPPNGYYDPQYKGMSSMQIYKKLMNQAHKPKCDPQLKFGPQKPTAIAFLLV